MADEILTKLEALQVSIHNVEKLHIESAQQMKTIQERGCIQGERMNAELEKKIMKEVNFISRMVKGIVGFSTTIGALIALKK